MSNTMPLKYLFQVTYKSGETYTQNEEDRSVTEPETRSCYFDIKVEDVKSFFLFDNTNTYSVNVEDGHFEVNGVPFFMHTDTSLKDFRLVYYRRHTHNMKVGVEKNEEIDHIVEYCMGWQTTDENGKNVQRIMTLP